MCIYTFLPWVNPCRAEIPAGQGAGGAGRPDLRQDPQGRVPRQKTAGNGARTECVAPSSAPAGPDQSEGAGLNGDGVVSGDASG